MNDRNLSRIDGSMQRAGERFTQELAARFEQAAPDWLQKEKAGNLDQTHIQGEPNG